GLGEPEVAVRSRRDVGDVEKRSRDGVIVDGVGDRIDLTDRSRADSVPGEPEVAVGARRDPPWVNDWVAAVRGGGAGVRVEGVCRWVALAGLVGECLGEPEVSVRSRRDPPGPGAGGGNGE